MALTSEGAAKERDRADSLIRQNDGIQAYIKIASTKTQTEKQATEETEAATEETKAATTATTKQKEAVWGLGIALSQLAKQFNTLSSERAIETFGIDVDKTADAIMNAHSELDKLIKLTPDRKSVV